MKKSDLVGIVKEIDGVGRMVVPKEFRDRFGLKDYIEIIPTKDGVLIKSLNNLRQKKG